MSTVALMIDGKRIEVAAGTTVAAALRIADQVNLGATRRSVSGELRAPVCGMGVCHECRVLIDGRVRLACQTLCSADLQIVTLVTRTAP